MVGFDVLIAAFSHLHVILPKCSNSNPATGQDGQERSFLVAPLLDRGFLVCGQYFVFMQLDRVYVRRLLVVLVVHISHAPLPAHYLSLKFVVMCQYQHNFIDSVDVVQSSSKNGIRLIVEMDEHCG